MLSRLHIPAKLEEPVIRPPTLTLAARRRREPQPHRLGVLPQGRGDHPDRDYLARVAAEINDRPRKILDWKKPSELFTELLDTNASTG